MRTAIKTIMLIVALTLLGTSCTADATEEAVAAETTTTVATTTTTEPPPDPAEKAAATLEANTEAFLAQDLDAYLATITEDAEFLNRSMNTHWVGEAQFKSSMRTIFAITDPDATEIIDQFVSDDGTFGVVNANWVGENSYGTPFDLTYVQLMEFENGLINRLTMYWEDQDVRKQLNALPDS